MADPKPNQTEVEAAPIIVNANLDLWNSLEKTAPSATKQFTRGGGFKGTAINGTYILKRLTETFGVCGKGWRFVLDDERIETGHTLKNGDHAKVHIIRGHLEYREGDEWFSASPQFGQTMLVDENKYGTFTDEEAPKKSITDCIAKCAVQLGIGADIHMGLYDDNKYLNERKAEEAAEKKAKSALTPPPAPSTNLSPEEEIALDRAAAREANGETLDHDPETGEVIEEPPAVVWARNAIDTVRGFKDLKAYDAWRTKKVSDAIVRLGDIDANVQGQLTQAIEACLDRLNPIGA